MPDTQEFKIKSNDTAPSIREQLYGSTGAVLDLSSCSIRFHLVDADGVTVVDADADIDDALTGWVSYDWQTADTQDLAAGKYYREWQVTLPSGKIITIPNDKRGYVVKVTDDLL